MNVEQNKQSIGAAGSIQAVAPFLDASKDMLKPVQFAVIGILKLLAVGDGKTREMEVYTADAFISNIDSVFFLYFFFFCFSKQKKVFNATQIVTTEQSLDDGASDNISPLDRVVEFIQRVDDMAAKSEATRVLVNLIKTAWSQGSIP
jgi:hypothetical protein